MVQDEDGYHTLMLEITIIEPHRDQHGQIDLFGETAYGTQAELLTDEPLKEIIQIGVVLINMYIHRA
jgi:hypothetical protein